MWSWEASRHQMTTRTRARVPHNKTQPRRRKSYRRLKTRGSTPKTGPCTPLPSTNRTRSCTATPPTMAVPVAMDQVPRPRCARTRSPHLACWPYVVVETPHGPPPQSHEYGHPWCVFGDGGGGACGMFVCVRRACRSTWLLAWVLHVARACFAFVQRTVLRLLFCARARGVRDVHCVSSRNADSCGMPCSPVGTNEFLQRQWCYRRRRVCHWPWWPWWQWWQWWWQWWCQWWWQWW